MIQQEINWFKKIKYSLHIDLHVLTYDFEASYSFTFFGIKFAQDQSVVSGVKLSELEVRSTAYWINSNGQVL